MELGEKFLGSWWQEIPAIPQVFVDDKNPPPSPRKLLEHRPKVMDISGKLLESRQKLPRKFAQPWPHIPESARKVKD